MEIFKKANLIDHSIKDVHDWAIISINGKVIGKLDRRRGENTVKLPTLKAKAQLDILVEGMGRVNYDEAIIDRKGITDQAKNSQPKRFPHTSAIRQKYKRCGKGLSLLSRN